MATDSTKHEERTEQAQPGQMEKKIEIERKFTVTENAGERILQAGGTCVKETSFQDEYFDTNSYQFTLADHWLRKRDGSWELKASIHEDKLNETCSKYVEIEDENDITQRLAAILKSPEVNTTLQQRTDNANNSSSLEELLQQHDVQNFAKFKTTRKCYQIGDDVSVVLDTTDFGFNVGEIEIMTTESEVAQTVQRLEKLSQDLGQYSDRWNIVLCCPSASCL